MFITHRIRLSRTVEFSPDIGAFLLLETMKFKLIFLPQWLIIQSHSPITGICLPLHACNLFLVGFKSALCLNLF